MTGHSKREPLEAIHPRYRRASKAEKTRILDEFVAITGYHRKHAIRLLKHGVKAPGEKKRGWPKLYTGEVISALIKIWKVCDCIRSKRLHPFLPEMMAVPKRNRELTLSEETKRLLLQMSPATIDRCLRRGLSTTKPGTLLKQAIPVRTFADWPKSPAPLDCHPGLVRLGAGVPEQARDARPGYQDGLSIP